MGSDEPSYWNDEAPGPTSPRQAQRDVDRPSGARGRCRL